MNYTILDLFNCVTIAKDMIYVKKSLVLQRLSKLDILYPGEFAIFMTSSHVCKNA